MTSQNEDKDFQRKCDIEIFKIVADHFDQDIREFWTRANFYLLTHAALLSAYVVIYPTLSQYRVDIAILVPTLGLVIAIFWLLVLTGSQHWIKQWRKKMIELSKELDRFQCHCQIENLVDQKKLKSPSYITQYLPLVFIITWFAILLLTIFTIYPIQL